MEEDTGKLTHEGDSSLIDFNRSGVPLVEIVTEPDFDNAKDVKAYLQKLQQIVRYLDVSDADMEKGQMRLRTKHFYFLNPNSKELPKYKVEVKNINSFGFVEKAIDFEIKRQLEILEKGKTPNRKPEVGMKKKTLLFRKELKKKPMITAISQNRIFRQSDGQKNKLPNLNPKFRNYRMKN